MRLESIDSSIKRGNIRVPFLSKEDVESEGFEMYSEWGVVLKFRHTTSQSVLMYRKDKPHIKIFTHHGDVLYSGTCKNKSKLRQIMADVGIIE